MPEAQQRETVRRVNRAARTRGAQSDAPFSLPVIRSPKASRTRRDLLHEHRTEMLVDAQELGRSGATEFEIAQFFGVSQATINVWRAKDPQFDAALRLGRDLADDLVESSLYHKARGYTFQSEKIFQHEGQVIRVPTLEHVAPDTTAMIFWLKNRRRKDWTDQFKLDVDGQLDLNVKTDPKAFAIAMLATIRAALEEPPLTIDAEPQK